eukprot:TRINITY_DN24204_c0_g1_i3.p1 TRINITY_DN24204_c0_g1~~TRINITY_DN24204_c0_g1_i3.p1  ORF type:complete len:260 (+),score=-0.05 TRINITY_DN24204_c0_g1_i3:47-781(+)
MSGATGASGSDPHEPLNFTKSLPPGVERIRKILADNPKGGWDKTWEEGLTPWDLGGVTPAVATLVDPAAPPALRIPPAVRRMLVPGCGSGYDVEAFACDGRHVTGLDISPVAVDRATKRMEGSPNAASVQFVCADFFAYQPERPFDAIFDYTFFCALHPDMRPAWAAKTAELLAPEGILYTLMFPLEDHEGGPPYAVSRQSYASLLEPLGFAGEDLPTASAPAREGRELLVKWQRTSVHQKSKV